MGGSTIRHRYCQTSAVKRELTIESGIENTPHGRIIAGICAARGVGADINYKRTWIALITLWPLRADSTCCSGITLGALWPLWAWNVGLAHTINGAEPARAAAQRVGGAAGGGRCPNGAREGSGRARAAVWRRSDGR